MIITMPNTKMHIKIGKTEVPVTKKGQRYYYFARGRNWPVAKSKVIFS